MPFCYRMRRNISLFYIPKIIKSGQESAYRVDLLYKVYIRCKTLTSQNVSSEAKDKIYFIEKLCFILEIFKVLYF